MAHAVEIGSWIDLDDIEIRYIVPKDPDDDAIEFSFTRPTSFSLIMSERALTRCLETFPEALAKLKARQAADAG